MNLIKSSILTIKELMQRNENVSAVWVELESLLQVSEEAIKHHDSVIPLLPTDEQTKQNDWFSNVYKHSDVFIKDTKQWISVIESSTNNTQDQPMESAKCPLNSKDQNMSKISVHNQDEHSTASSTSSARIKAEADTAALLVCQDLTF